MSKFSVGTELFEGRLMVSITTGETITLLAPYLAKAHALNLYEIAKCVELKGGAYDPETEIFEEQSISPDGVECPEKPNLRAIFDKITGKLKRVFTLSESSSL